MSLAAIPPSSTPGRRPKAFAVRSFPTANFPATKSEQLPAASGNFAGDQKLPSFALINHPPYPTSCGPGKNSLSYRGKSFKPPAAFAFRKFPEGCGPLKSSNVENCNTKSSQTPPEIDQKLIDVVKSCVVRDFVKDGKMIHGKSIEKCSKEETSLGGKDAEKSGRESSVLPEFVKDGRRICKSKVEGVEEKLNEKDGKNVNGKRLLVPDLVENGGSEGGRLVEVRGDRLIVQALMAAKNCPWMQGKGRGSIGLQSRQKKPRKRTVVESLMV